MHQATIDAQRFTDVSLRNTDMIWPRCAKSSLIGYDEAAHEVLIIPTTCGRWDCPDCATHKASVYAAKIFAAKPERAITLTMDPSLFASPRTCLERMNQSLSKLATAIRNEGIVFEYAAVRELHKSGWPHMHLATWGDFVPVKLIQRLWHKFTGATIVHVFSLASNLGSAHNWTKYLTKADSFPDSVFNGTRRVTFSRAYHRYPRIDEPQSDATPIIWFWTRLTAREALRQLQSMAMITFTAEDGCWQVHLLPDTTSIDLTAAYVRNLLEVTR